MHAGDVLDCLWMSAVNQNLIRLVIPRLQERAAGTRTPLLLDIGVFPDETETMSVFSSSSKLHINCFDISPNAIYSPSKFKHTSEHVFPEVRSSKEFVVESPSDLYRLVSSLRSSLFVLTKPSVVCTEHYKSFS